MKPERLQGPTEPPPQDRRPFRDRHRPGPHSHEHANHEFWDHYRQMHARHSHWRGRRPGFFMKVFMFFFILCLALLITFCSGEGFSWKHLFHFLGWIVLIQFLAFMGLRRMFGPMRHLMRGVQEIADGNLDFRFPPKGRGEFDFLAYHFNRMADRVKEMVHSKEQLLLDVSHELRSPLTRLKVALELSPRSKLKPSMMLDIAEMETMLAEILETEHLKRDHGKLVLESLDLAAVLREMAAKYKGRKPGIKFLGKPQGFVVPADRTRVKTLFQNVLENALKYSGHQKKPVEVRVESRDGQIWAIIHDDGVGIPAEDQEMVFEPFYRVDKSRTKETGGYGLGLSLCREIMKAHGGEISLESAPGEGTQVILKFPLSAP